MKTQMLGSALGAAVVATAIAWSPAAEAALTPCNLSQVTGSNDGGVMFMDAVACINSTDLPDDGMPPPGPPQNDSEDVLNDNMFFGIGTWQFAQKQETDDGTLQDLETDIDLGLSVAFDTNEVSMGTWSVTDFGMFESFVIILKAGPEFTAFFFDDATKIEGTFGYPEPPALSHFSLYVSEEGGNGGPDPMPAPATLLGLGLGLAGLGVMVRRRRR